MKGIIRSAIPAAVALALAGTSGLALGEQKQMSKEWPSFRKADADNSGAISQDEARTIQGLETDFSQHDKNSDGQLSRSEYESAKKAAKSGASGTSGAGGSTPSKPLQSGGRVPDPADRGPVPRVGGSEPSGSGGAGGSGAGAGGAGAGGGAGGAGAGGAGGGGSQ